MTHIIGHDGERIYVAGEHDVTCIELSSGIRLWREDIPAKNLGTWRGRGILHNNQLLLPDNRAILVRSVGPGAVTGLVTAWKRIELPDLSVGRESLSGPFNINVNGRYLSTAFENGIVVYSTGQRLLEEAEQATDLSHRAMLQAQAGDLISAFRTLESIDLENAPTDHRQQVATRLLSLGGELAIAMAAHGARTQALDILERTRNQLTTERENQHWHLSRIDVFQTLGDLDAVLSEQDALYELIDGE